MGAVGSLPATTLENNEKFPEASVRGLGLREAVAERDRAHAPGRPPPQRAASLIPGWNFLAKIRRPSNSPGVGVRAFRGGISWRKILWGWRARAPARFQPGGGGPRRIARQHGHPAVAEGTRSTLVRSRVRGQAGLRRQAAWHAGRRASPRCRGRGSRRTVPWPLTPPLPRRSGQGGREAGLAPHLRSGP